MKLIPLTQGQSAMIDDWNYDWLMQWKWYANKSRGTYYAVRHEKINDRVVAILMHREIMATPKGMVVDHINHDGLNNLESNLRNCTESQNQRNQRRMEGRVHLSDNYLPLHRVNADNPSAFFDHSRPRILDPGVCYQLSFYFKYENKKVSHYKRHGLSYIKEYDTFLNIRARCNKPHHPDYKNYGARGIKIYKEWLSDPKLFIDYVKMLPDYGTANYSLDRINNDGNYEPGNLRWASRLTQSNNKRKSNQKWNGYGFKKFPCITSSISGYYGIAWNCVWSGWEVRLPFNGKRVFIGSSKDINIALKKRNEFMQENGIENLDRYFIKKIS